MWRSVQPLFINIPVIVFQDHKQSDFGCRMETLHLSPEPEFPITGSSSYWFSCILTCQQQRPALSHWGGQPVPLGQVAFFYHIPSTLEEGGVCLLVTDMCSGYESVVLAFSASLGTTAWGLRHSGYLLDHRGTPYDIAYNQVTHFAMTVWQ